MDKQSADDETADLAEKVAAAAATATATHLNPNEPTSNRNVDNLSPSKKIIHRVNYSNTLATDLNSISSVAGAKSPVHKSIPNSLNLPNDLSLDTVVDNNKKHLTKNRDRFASYGELKSILKRSVRHISNKGSKESSFDLSRQNSKQIAAATSSTYGRDASECSQMSPGTFTKNSSDSSDCKQKKMANDRDFNEILKNNHHLYKFYITRLKHSLIISFLILMPIQNIFLFIVSLLSEQVCGIY